MTDRRALLRNSLAIAATATAQAGPAAQRDNRFDYAPSAQRRTRNVRDFGAKGDGVTDDTEAFNRATQADAEWSWDMLASIVVPAGRYKIAGTVFLRKGQSLIGEGLSTYIDAAKAQHSTFIMGRRRDTKRGTEDPGGLPVRIERLMGLGGAASEGFIYATIPGFQISTLFLTAVGMGIEIEAGDGIVSDVEIDQCLTAIFVRNSQNLVLSNLNFYLANYGLSLADNCRDIAVVNATFCYTRYAAILLGDGASDITSVSITGCIFTNNVPYDTFEGYIYSRASHSDLLVTGCTFRNAPAFAIQQGAGTDLTLTIQGCVFDGQRTNPDYNQSLSPKAIRTGHGRFVVAGCTFRRMVSDAISVGPGLITLDVDGGVIEDVAGTAISVEGEHSGVIAIRHIRGLARVATEGGDHSLTLPWLGTRARWQITINGRDANAPTPAAQFLVAVGPSGPIAHTISSMGAPVVLSVIGPQTLAGEQHMPQLRIPARQFGPTTPSADVSVHA